MKVPSLSNLHINMTQELMIGTQGKIKKICVLLYLQFKTFYRLFYYLAKKIVLLHGVTEFCGEEME